MPSELKRPLASSIRSVSPPATRRRITAPPAETHETGHTNPSRVRIYSWNVNGVRPLLQKPLSFDPEACFPLREFLKRHHWPAFLCLQEVKISLNDDTTQRRLQRAANAESRPHEPTYTSQLSLPRDKYNALGFGGKVYGVATFVRRDVAHLVEKIRNPGWDLEGRVLIHELNNGLAIINGYWVNGTSNPYHNPTSGIVEGTRHDHKLRFHQCMLDEAVNLKNNGKHVVLVGDMNVARCHLDGHPKLRTAPEQHVRNRADLNRKFFEDPDGLKAIDVFRELHGETHPTPTTLNAITATDICDNPQDRGHSDHVPLWVEVDLDKLPSMLIDNH